MRGNKLWLRFNISLTKLFACFKKINFSFRFERSDSIFSEIKNKEKRLERSSTALRDQGEIRVNWARKANSAPLATRRGHGSNYAIEDDRRGTIDDRG